MPVDNDLLNTLSSPTSQEEFMRLLDELLRRYAGTSLYIGKDVNPTQYSGLADAGFTVPATSEWQDVLEPEYRDYAREIQYKDMGLSEQARREASRTKASIEDTMRKISEHVGTTVGGVTENGGVEVKSGGVTKYIYYPPAPDSSEDTGLGTVRFTGDGSSAHILKLYSDGTALLSDGTIRKLAPFFLKGGVSGLQEAMFGKVYRITQEYGNWNPALEPTGTNIGLDIGVHYQPISFPLRGKVVQVLRYDGRRFSPAHHGYGNSILIMLPTGESFRLSHLSQINVHNGQIVEPGMVVGITGATGNTTGPHLDLEYRNSSGHIDNPENFKGFHMTPEQAAEVYGTDIGIGEVIPEGRLTEEQIRDIVAIINGEEPHQGQPQEQQQSDKYRPDEGNLVARAVAQTGHDMGMKDYGISEAIDEGDPTGTAGGLIGLAGDAVNAPELGISEALQQYSEDNPGGHSGNSKWAIVRQLLGNVVDEGATGLTNIFEKRGIRVPDMGISELLAGKETVNTRNALNKMAQWKSSVGNVAQRLDNLGEGNALGNVAMDIASKVTGDLNRKAYAKEQSVAAKTSVAGNGNTGTQTKKTWSRRLPDTAGGANTSIGSARPTQTTVATGASTPGVAGTGTVNDSIVGRTIRNELDVRNKINRYVYGPWTKPVDYTKETNVNQPQQPEQPQYEKSPLEKRLEEMRKQGKSLATSKKYAKLYRRLKELKKEARKEAEKRGLSGEDAKKFVYDYTRKATRTGYKNKKVERAKKWEKRIKDRLYKGKKVKYDVFSRYLSKARDAGTSTGKMIRLFRDAAKRRAKQAGAAAKDAAKRAAHYATTTAKRAYHAAKKIYDEAVKRLKSAVTKTKNNARTFFRSKFNKKKYTKFRRLFSRHRPSRNSGGSW